MVVNRLIDVGVIKQRSIVAVLSKICRSGNFEQNVFVAVKGSKASSNLSAIAHIRSVYEIMKIRIWRCQ